MLIVAIRCTYASPSTIRSVPASALDGVAASPAPKCLESVEGGEKSVSSKKKKRQEQPTYKRDNVAGTVHAEDGSCTESPLLACAFSALHWYVCVQKERLGKIATQIIFPK